MGQVEGPSWLPARFLALEELTAPRGVVRWRVEDRANGEVLEAWAASPELRTDRAAHAAFRACQEALFNARDEALVRARPTEDGTFYLRSALDNATLEQVEPPLGLADVAAIGARLLPAILAAGSANRGLLLKSDIGLDARGQPVFAPTGRPVSRVDRAINRSTAPEVEAGEPVRPESGLYGLGRLLYWLATGREPDGPFAAPLRTVRPEAPPELELAVQRLLSRDPAERRGALPLLQDLAGPLPDLRSKSLPQPAPSLNRPAPAPVVPLVRAALVLPARALASLNPEQVSAAAGAAGTTVAEVERRQRARLGLPLRHFPSRSKAKAALSAAREETQLPVALAASTGALVPALGLAAGLGLLAAWLVGALIAVFLSLPAGALVAALGSLLVALPALATLPRWREARVLAESPPLVELNGAQKRLAEARRRLAAMDLPEAIAQDIRGLLREMERRVEALREVESLAEETLASADRSLLVARLARLEREASHEEAQQERNRLAKALADLDRVTAERDRARQEASAIERSVDELLGAAGAAASDATTTSPEQAQALAQRARRLSAALKTEGP